jgi:hypothetical protein
MRLFRTIILLGAAGLLLPSPPEELAKGIDADQPSTFEVLSSAGSAASDAWSFCSRQPDVCGVAGYLAGRLEAKALYSASLLWGWAWEGDTETGKGQGPFAVITVDGDMPPPATSDPGGQSTLGLDDLVPAWRGPAKEG